MTATVADAGDLGAAEVADDEGPLSGRRRTLERLRGRREAQAAAVFVGLLVVVAVVAPWLAPHDPDKQNLREVLANPSGDYWLGTDGLGRDNLSRLLVATRVALVASAEAVLIGLALGVPLGLLVGYRGGWWDRIVMRLAEAVISLPAIVVAVAILTILGKGLSNAMIAIGIVFGMAFLRLTRGTVLAVREELFVDASRVIGTRDRTILVRHVLPNVAPPLIVQTTLAFGTALLAEAGLSFLGLGVQPPQASWGSMLAEAAPYVRRNWFVAVPPGVVIALTVLAFNLLGDAIRDSIGRGVQPTPLRRAAIVARREPVPAVAATALDPAIDPGSEAVPVLEVAGLEVGFRGPRGEVVPAVTGVSFHVEAGETLGLVGESGCGKSVTALAVVGLLPTTATVTADRVAVAGEDLSTLSDRELRRLRGGTVGVVFQDPMTSLNPAFTVGNQLGEALQLHLPLDRSARRARSRELLDSVRIRDPAGTLKAYPHELSGGMAQRVMIAMALACEPKLLIADEPTTALDVTVQGQIVDLLRDLQADLGMGILFITHDLGVVADVCDRAAVMYAGELVETATVPDLFAAPSHPYTQGLLRSRPHREAKGGALPTIPGAVPLPGHWPAGCRFQTRCSFAAEACRQPQALLSMTPEHQVRCVRHDDPALAAGAS